MVLASLALAVFLGLVAAGSALALARWPRRWTQALVWILVLQNVTVILIWKLTGSAPAATSLLFAKEAVIAGASVSVLLLALQGLRGRRLPPIVWMAIGFCALCAVWVPLSWLRHEPPEQIVRGLRSLVFPVLVFIVGYIALRDPRTQVALRRTLWWAAIVLGISVVVERTVIPPDYWLSIGLADYWVNVRGQSDAMLNGGLPWNFFTTFMGSVVRRGFGIMTDPLGLSYFLLLPLGLAVMEIWKTQGRTIPRLPLAAAVISSVGICFSISRVPIAVGGVLIGLAPIVAIGLVRGQRRRALGLAAVSALIYGVILFFSMATSPRIGPSDFAAGHPIGTSTEGTHLAGLLRAQHWQPLVFGEGLGKSGYLSSKFAATPNEIAYENYYLDAAAQVGVLGAGLLIALLFLATRQLLTTRGELGAIAVPTGVVLGLLAVAGLISGQLEVITSLGSTWLFAGVAVASTVGSAPEVGAVIARSPVGWGAADKA